MTPEQHNNYLSWSHFGLAAFNGALMLFMMLMMGVLLRVEPNPPPWPLKVFFQLFIGFFMVIMTLPSLLAWHALRKRKRWAKTMSIIAGVMASMNAPIGTAVCVYTFWFLFSEPGKLLYDNPQRMLPHDRGVPRNMQDAAARKHQYVSPPSPPDWR